MFNKLRETTKWSQSEIIRNALKFYYTHKELEDFNSEKVKIYVKMLAEGEHVILDLDHLISFLRIVETHPEKEKFWEIHKEVARSHAEQFRDMNIEQILKRLEACNFFRLGRSGKDYILIFGSENVRKFTRTFLEEILKGLNKNAEIKEDLTKLRIEIK